MSREEIFDRLAISKINRPVEIEFLDSVLSFADSTRYPAAIRYVDETQFYIVIPSAEEPSSSTNTDAFRGASLVIYPMGIRGEVESSVYQPGFGHLLAVPNSGIPLRRFLRVAFSKKLLVSILDDEPEPEEIEVYALNLSGSGIAIQCRRGIGLTDKTVCQLKIMSSDFPGYDPYQGFALLKGEVMRVFPDHNVPNSDNVGLHFVFDDAFEEFKFTHQIDELCRRIAFPEGHSGREFSELLDLTADISSSLDIDTVLFKINASASSLVSSEASSILLFDDQHLNLEFKAASGDKTPILKNVQVSPDTGGIAWWVIQTGEPAIVHDVDSDPRFTGAVDHVTGFRTRSILAVPVIWEREILGVLEAVNKLEGAKFTEYDLQQLTALANQIAIIIRNAQKTEKYENFFTNVIELIAKAIESTGVLMGLMSTGHCWRVAALATAIGQEFDMSDDEFDDLYYGAVLHDIGLLEPQNQSPFQIDGFDEESNLTTGERIKTHPVIGANMIKGIQLLQGATPIVRHHHERFDGMGYPDGLEGEAIPLGARIVAVIEAYEEMLYGQEDRPSAQQQAVFAISNGSGTRFDPQVVEVFADQFRQR